MSESTSKVAKRRACDECSMETVQTVPTEYTWLTLTDCSTAGSRKLACSKEPDGCERCVRERINCHYSEQKQMGRPRKRQFIETTGDSTTPENTLQDLGTLPFFADNLGYNEGDFTEPYFTGGHMLEASALSEEPKESTMNNSGIWSQSNELTPTRPVQYGQVDFGNINFDSILESEEILPLDQTPQLSSTSTTSLADAESPKNVPCSCLASMYLSLAALQQFPSDISAALYAVRSAADTAQKCIWCPQCGSVLISEETPPIESFQNTMILGTLLPVIANGYGRLLEMVDDEAAAATSRGETKIFDIQRYGGINCDIKSATPERLRKFREDEQMYYNKEMQPDMWRNSVRQMLKIDIYGFESKEEGCHYKGLRAILQEMEDRQRTRHHILDAHAEAGTTAQAFPKGWQGGHFHHNVNRPQECLGEKTFTCLQILKIAKYAIDSLVIP